MRGFNARGKPVTLDHDLRTTGYALCAIVLLSLAMHIAWYRSASAVPFAQGTPYDCNTASGLPVIECQALVTLYNGTNGTGWTNRSGWLSTLTPCTWYGVTCTGGHVTRLDLRSNRLLGAIPSEFQNLPSLTYLYLQSNQLTGTIPPALGSLPNLLDLWLAANQLTGQIPAELGNLAALKSLWLDTNQLSGTIPPQLGNLSNLTYLGMRFNQLTGTIPPELENLSRLTELWLASNRLSGNIPPQLGNLTNLTHLYLRDNQLNGPIPASLGNLTHLVELSLSFNQLSNTIPPQLGNLSALTGLWLHHNQLTGTIPPEITQLSGLTAVELNNNLLGGAILPELGNLVNLTSLLLYDNQFTGQIPVQLSSLARLKYLRLDQNQLSGAIPTELGNLGQLQQLALFGNQLTGTIPPQLGGLSMLQGLWLNDNRLNGEIPASLGNLTALLELDLSCNQLSGVIPTTLINLSNLPLHSNDLGYNKLTASGPALLSFLTAMDPDWADTQTVPPTNLQATVYTTRSVQLTWTPIKYTSDGGYSEIMTAVSPGGPYTVHGVTARKSSADFLVMGLSPDTDYYFAVRTYTPPHTTQQNALTSDISASIAVHTPAETTVRFGAPTYSASEASQQATMTVVLGSASSITVTAGFATSDGTATSNQDYVAASGILTFAGGVTSQTFTVALVDDTSHENDETVTLELVGASNATIGSPYRAVLTIVDDDPEQQPVTCFPLTLAHSGAGTDPVATPANSPGCSAGQYLAGATITIDARPAEGWQVGRWYGTADDGVSGTGNAVTMPAGSHTVSVEYTKRPDIPAALPDGYETDDNCAQAKEIPADGSAQTHTFHKVGDTDWVRYSAAAGAEYRVEVQAPPGSPADVTLEVYPLCEGEAAYSFAESFTPGVRLDLPVASGGPVYLRLTSTDTAVAGAEVAYQLSVRRRETSASGTLILVAGRLKAGDVLQKNIHMVTQTVYDYYADNGYGADDILYLATDAGLSGYDQPATVSNLRAAIVTWAAAKTASNKLLTLYFMDHGDADLFYLDGVNKQQFTPAELHGWLAELEAAVPDVKVNIIIEACYSGSFINGVQRISRPGRLVLASTSDKQLAYASRAGAYFSDQFLAGMRQGYSMSNSFRMAYAVSQELTGLLQEPWLDANGNGVANETADLTLATQRRLGTTENTTADVWAPYVVQANGPATISNRRGMIDAEVRDNQQVHRVWAVIYPPSYRPPVSSQELVPETLPAIVLQAQGSNRYQAEYPGFDEVGVYRVAVYAEDKEGLLAQPKMIQFLVGNLLYLPIVRQ